MNKFASKRVQELMYIYTNARLIDISLKEKKRKANVNATKGHEFFIPFGVKKILAMWQRLKGFVPTYNNITIGNYIDCFDMLEKD